MKKTSMGLLLMVILSFSLVICSAAFSQQFPNLSLSNSGPPPIEQANNFLTAQSGKRNNSESGKDADQNKDDQQEQNTSSKSKCLITLTSDDNRQIDCARAYNIKGEITVIQGTAPEIRRDIKELSINTKGNQTSASSREFDSRLEALLADSISNKVEIKDGSSKFLFNTLDLAAAGKNVTFKFSPKDEPSSIGSGCNDAGKNKCDGLEMSRIQLDFGKLMVSNAIPDFDNLSNNSTEALIPRSKTISSQKTKLTSPLQDWWQISKAQINSLRLSLLLPNNWFIRPAVASTDNQYTITSPTLRLETPEASVDTAGAVYLIERDASRQKTQIFSMTMRPVKVTDRFNRTVELRRNQTVLVTETGITEDPFEFPLCGAFYRRNSDVLEGLAPEEDDFVVQQPFPLQVAYHTARSMTLPLYHRNCQRRCAPKGSA